MPLYVHRSVYITSDQEWVGLARMLSRGVLYAIVAICLFFGWQEIRPEWTRDDFGDWLSIWFLAGLALFGYMGREYLTNSLSAELVDTSRAEKIRKEYRRMVEAQKTNAR